MFEIKSIDDKVEDNKVKKDNIIYKRCSMCIASCYWKFCKIKKGYEKNKSITYDQR